MKQKKRRKSVAISSLPPADAASSTASNFLARVLSFAPQTEIQRLGLTLLFMTIFVLRIPDVLRNPQFWAEDGTIFFRENLCDGVQAIGNVYAGYHNLIPRLAALLAGTFSPVYAPEIFLGVALALTASVIYMVQSSRFPLPCRALLALAIALTSGGLETFGNITNIQWFLAMGVVAVLLMRPVQSRIVTSMEAAFVAVSGFTGPFVLLLLPVFTGRLFLDWKNHGARKRMLVLMAVAVVGASVQLYTLVNNPVDNGTDPNVPATETSDVPMLTAAAIFTHTLGALLGQVVNRVFPGHPPSLTTVGCFGMAEVAVFLVLVVSSLKTVQLRFERLALFYFGSVVLLAAVFKFRDSMFELVPAINGSRYFLIPTVVACWLLLSAVRGVRMDLPAVILLGLLLVSALVGFIRDPLINYDWPAWAKKLEAGSKPRIPINPESWFVETNCAVPQ